MKRYLRAGLAAGALALAAGPAYATVDFYLAAKAFTKTMPDTTTVPMWGYVVDTGDTTSAHCYDYTGAGSAALRLACVNGLPDPAVPGPRLTAGAGDPNFRVFLTNGLPEPTSLVISSQEMPWSATNNGPTWNDGSLGSRVDLTQRVRSFGREAAANGGRRPYIWTNFRDTPFTKSGTFLYHSGTYPQKQVYMGLYGAVTRDAVAANAGAGTPAEVYPGVPYDQEITLFYSDIDPLLNAAIANGTYTTSIHYQARWFLVNGEPYVPGMPDVAAGLAGSNTLVRLLNAASETHVPTLQGLYWDIQAEDGYLYNWQDGVTGVTTPAPRTQYTAMLPALKTKDAILTAPAAGRYAVYDGNGYMTNPSDPADVNLGDTLGGMLRFLAFGVGANQPPVANPDVASTTQGAVVVVQVLTNDSDPDGDPLTVTSATSGSANGGVTTDGTTVTYTPAATFFGVDSFTYVISDGQGNSATGSATVTVNRNNTAPVANLDTATTTTNVAVNIDVLFNDTDAENDALTITGVTQGASGTATTDGSTVTYTPNASFNGVDSFTYDISDGFGGTATGNVSVTVSPVANRAPVAVADAANVNEDAILDVAAPGVLANDSDPDGDALTATLVSGPSCAWTAGPSGANAFVLNPDGSYHYEPIPNWNSALPTSNPFCSGSTGPDTFTYEVSDGNGGTAQATVTITVNEVNDAPIANADTLFMTQMGSMTFAAPGVLANDNDVDLIPFDPAQLTAVRETNPTRGNITGWTLNATPGGDGGFTYNFANGRVGTVATLSYHANDGLANSNSVTVTIRRELSVKVATCEFDPQTTTCNWVIEGRNIVPNGTLIEAWLGPFGTGQLIGTHTEVGGRGWAMQIAGSGIIPNPGDVINVRALGQPNAVITDFPVTIQ